MAKADSTDAALEALFVPVENGLIELPEPVLFLRARMGPAMLRNAGRGWHCQQSFKPWADALQAARFTVEPHAPAAQFATVLALPPRQRQEARATLASAVALAGPNGRVVVSVPNQEGARTVGADLALLVGPLQGLSKHHCRVFWTAHACAIDQGLLDEWRALDTPQPIGDGYISRPGLFAWDRVDPGSALLASQLPSRLAGRVADLGGGYGLLGCELLRRCPAIRTLDLYEAEARALEPAEANLSRVNSERDEPVATGLFWHDVTAGLSRRYDVIVSNPPFHAGRADRPELGRAFIEAAADALAPGGELWLVANRHLPYEATLSARFSEVRAVAAEAGYKVYQARGVRT